MGAKAAERVLTRASARVRKLVAIAPVPASGVPFDEQGWALFSGAADNPANRYAIIDFTSGRLHPVKATVGINDFAITADVVKATCLQWYPNAELEIIPNAGHYPMEETPIALATSFERFLRE